jgi:hypothetical protein
MKKYTAIMVFLFYFGLSSTAFSQNTVSNPCPLVNGEDVLIKDSDVIEGGLTLNDAIFIATEENNYLFQEDIPKEKYQQTLTQYSIEIVFYNGKKYILAKNMKGKEFTLIQSLPGKYSLGLNERKWLQTSIYPLKCLSENKFIIIQ